MGLQGGAPRTQQTITERDDLTQIRTQRHALRDRIAAAKHAGEVDQEALQAVPEDLATLMSTDVAAGGAALWPVIAQDDEGQRRLDVIADEQAAPASGARERCDCALTSASSSWER